jgi:hypothetical protein
MAEDGHAWQRRGRPSAGGPGLSSQPWKTGRFVAKVGRIVTMPLAAVPV